MPSLIKTLRFTTLLCLSILLLTRSAFAIALIRDQEIETTLKEYSFPIFDAAGLTPESVRFFIVNSPEINAFVAGGSNIFINTGLIMATKNPAMLIGVIAHETGHISGGHLPQGAEKMKNAQLGVIFGYILGAAAAASGQGDVGSAIMSSSGHIATRGLLSFTRLNEQAADHAALRYLDRVNISAAGMLEMFEILKKQEDRHFGKIDPYAVTHPLSKERITTVRNHVVKSTIPAGQIPLEFEVMYKRMIAKLTGFMEPFNTTMSKYPDTDTSVEAKYARAIAYYRVPNLPRALSEIDGLLKEFPQDVYFNELKGQILFENGKVKEAIPFYQKAVSLMPNAQLIRVELAKALLALEKDDVLNDAIMHLQRSVSQDNSHSDAWRLLASAYGRKGDMGMSYLALAEEALLQNKPEAASQQAKQALKHLSPGSPSLLRAEDIIALAKQAKENG